MLERADRQLLDHQVDVMTNNVTVTVGDEFVNFDNHRGIQRAATAVHTCLL